MKKGITFVSAKQTFSFVYFIICQFLYKRILATSSLGLFIFMHVYLSICLSLGYSQSINRGCLDVRRKEQMQIMRQQMKILKQNQYAL